MEAQKIINDDMEAYRKRIEKELKLSKSYGGYEGKIENGELVHFKYWVSKKK